MGAAALQGGRKIRRSLGLERRDDPAPFPALEGQLGFPDAEMGIGCIEAPLRLGHEVEIAIPGVDGVHPPARRADRERQRRSHR